MSSEVWFLGVDIGAGSLKSMLVSPTGKVGGSASKDIVTRSPSAGWSEQNPADWWVALCETVPRALEAAGAKAEQVMAVGFSAGAHTPVLEDAQGRVIRPAILWSDQRSALEARELQEKYGEEILSIGCNRPVPTWTQPQLLWLARHEPEALSRTHRLYVAKDWLRSQLTGSWETDATEAVGTLLYDGSRNCWSDRLCEMINLDKRILPPVVRPTDIVGTVSAAAASACGLAPGTPVVCGTSDTSIEAYGAGAIAPGDGAVKLATAATVSVIGNSPRIHPTLINYPFVVPGYWYTLSATNSCASAHRWLRDRFFLRPGEDGGMAFSEMDHLASQIEPGSEGLIFHPYLQGERAPHWDPLLRADFTGLTFRHDRGHLVRALYEGIAFSLRDVKEQLLAQGIGLNEARIIGGGARSQTWRQIVADILNVTILMPEVTDASFGAALISAVGVRAFDNEASAVKNCVRLVSRNDPIADHRGLYEDLYGVYRDASINLINTSHRLAALKAKYA